MQLKWADRLTLIYASWIQLIYEFECCDVEFYHL